MGGDTDFHDASARPLAWTDAVARVADTRVADAVYELARKNISERDLVNLTLAIVAINGWNRLTVAFRAVPGSYQPAKG